MNAPTYNDNPINLNTLLQTMQYLINNFDAFVYDICTEIQSLEYSYCYKTMKSEQLFYKHFNLVNRIDGFVVLIYETLNKANLSLYNRNIEEDDLDVRLNQISAKLKKQYYSNFKHCNLLFKKIKELSDFRNESAHPYSIIPRIKLLQNRDTILEILHGYYYLLSEVYSEISEFEHRRYLYNVLDESYGNANLASNISPQNNDELSETVRFVR